MIFNRIKPDEKKSLRAGEVILLLFFLGGVLLGYFMLLAYQDDELVSVISGVINDSFSYVPCSERFVEALLKNGFLFAFTTVLSMCPPLGIFTPIVAAYYGACFGFSAGILIKAYGGAGWLAAIRMMPHTMFVVFAIINCTKNAIMESARTLTGKQKDSRGNRIPVAISVILIFCSAVVEVLLYCII